MMTFQVNETIQYGMHGVCTIAEICERDVCGKATEYYMLKPVYDEKSTIFVPIDSAPLTAKMRRVLSVEEIFDLVASIRDEDAVWIEEENVRKEQYREALSGGNHILLIALFKAAHYHQIDLRENGKKLHVVDQRFMGDAEKMLHEEFAHVLHIEREQVLPFVMKELTVTRKQ